MERTDLDLTKKITRVLSDAQKIKVGMTRADLLRVFTTEGGVYTTAQRRYVHPACPYIKVEVEFAPKSQRGESGADRITKISAPFLEWSIYD